MQLGLKKMFTYAIIGFKSLQALDFKIILWITTAYTKKRRRQMTVAVIVNPKINCRSKFKLARMMKPNDLLYLFP